MSAAIECGIYTSNGMGLQSISWNDINNYLAVTGRKWRWLGIQLRKISLSYVKEYHAAKDPTRPSPYQERLDIELNRDNVKQQLKNFIKAKRKVD